MPQHEDKKFLNQQQAGPYIGVDPSTLSRWCKKGDGPPFYKVGAQKMFPKDELDKWLDERRNEGDNQE